MEIKKLAGVLVGSLIMGIASASAAVAVHDSGANGNTIIMSNYGNPATTFTATAVSHNVAFDCFNNLPETRLQFKVGGLGSGVINSSGSTANRFVVSWTQASTSNTVTFSPRFVAKETPGSGSTGSFTLTINYTTFSLQVTTSDTIKISYSAPVNGDSDITATPDAGATYDTSYKALSFSELVFDAAKFSGAMRFGSCFPSVVTPSPSQTPSQGATPRSTAAKYSGPEILAVDNFRPILSGGKLTFTGKNLSAVSSATIGSLAASLSYDATTGLTIGTPAGLAPGKYDLVMQSSYGKLTHINAVTIKAPTPTQTIGFKGEGEYLNEAQVAQLVEFNSSLNADYEKVRCIVNAADAEVAKAIAVRVCAHVARGEARNVEVIQDVRSTYQGSGFWVRVYAKG